VLLGNAGIERQVKLALSADVPPLTKQDPCGIGVRFDIASRGLHGRVILYLTSTRSPVDPS
jgi:hypothetical protein